jgi:AcrR family transcriptional regulator
MQQAGGPPIMFTSDRDRCHRRSGSPTIAARALLLTSMSRPRTASDADILDGAARAISRLGPARLTLADVATEVGLAPATLIQRFGSKRGLLLGLAQRARATVEGCFAAARLASPSPLGALLIAATDMARHAESPQSLANHLAFHQIDLGDPAFHDIARSYARTTLVGYEGLLRDAVAAGEIEPCDTSGLARGIQAMTAGSLLNWAIQPEGAALDWLRADLEMLLAPYRRSASPSSAGAPRSGPRARHEATGPNGLPSALPAAGGARPARPRRRGAPELS